jgi:hypothetical protein
VRAAFPSTVRPKRARSAVQLSDEGARIGGIKLANTRLDEIRDFGA